MSMSADFYTIRQAVLSLPVECRYHGTEFGALGSLGANEGGQPRCESCRAPWRRMCALAALDRVSDRLRRPSVMRALELISR